MEKNISIKLAVTCEIRLQNEIYKRETLNYTVRLPDKPTALPIITITRTAVGLDTYLVELEKKKA